MSERISPEATALQIRRYKITIARALTELSSWQPRYAEWEPVGIPVCRITMKALRDLDAGLSQLRTFLREQGWPSPPAPLPPMRPVWNLLGNACECSSEAAIAVRSYLPMSDSEEETALRKLLHARNQMSALLRSVHLFLLEIERFYPGGNADDSRALLLEIGESWLSEERLQDLLQDEARVLMLKCHLCTVLTWIKTIEGKDEEDVRLTAVLNGREVEAVKDALEQALLHVYVTLDVLALEKQAGINEFALWRMQAYLMLKECQKCIISNGNARTLLYDRQGGWRGSVPT